VVAANGDFIVSDRGNHSIRVLSPDGAVRTLVGNGEEGFADGQGADALELPIRSHDGPGGERAGARLGQRRYPEATMAGTVSTGK
jgi:hypothetical protein